jgi:hypothetical protein
VAVTLLREQWRTVQPFSVRDACPRDNEGLVALAAACSMAGDIELRIDRRPDFFALDRLERDRCRVAVAERDGEVVGCIAFSERESHLDGRSLTTGYVGDFKVHPAHRDAVVADELCRYVARAMRGLPDDTPVMITVLAGNGAMERRLDGPRGLPHFTHIATIRTHSLSILWKRGSSMLPLLLWTGTEGRSKDPAIRHAEWSDVEEMADLWLAVGSQRQFSPVYDAESLAKWIRESPGLDISSYRLARDRSGKLLGFLGLWDQRDFKQLSVVSYSHRMSAARRVFNRLAPLVGAECLPPEGSPLNLVTATNVCVPAHRADVLRALVVAGHNELRHQGYSLLNIGLDRTDPLNAAMRGLLAQPTDVNAYVTTARGKAWDRALDGTLHYEIALV